jgi:hypothetical protein
MSIVIKQKSKGIEYEDSIDRFYYEIVEQNKELILFHVADCDDEYKMFFKLIAKNGKLRQTRWTLYYWRNKEIVGAKELDRLRGFNNDFADWTEIHIYSFVARRAVVSA